MNLISRILAALHGATAGLALVLAIVVIAEYSAMVRAASQVFRYVGF